MRSKPLSPEALALTQQKQFHCEIEPNLTLRGDETSIRQMLSLLLDNAMKYSSSRGDSRLALKKIKKNKVLTLWNTADNLEIGKQNMLFERFYRPDSSRSTKTGGHGIGLSVVQAIVTAHRGKINAVSEDGKSILFTVIL